MKIGILTFHSAQNYGAALQCRCLYEVLRSLGHEVSVIDYRPDYLTAPYKLWKSSFAKHPMTMLKVSAKLAGAMKREAAFKAFESGLHLSPVDGSSFDAIFYGSDQIWNRNISGGVDPMFYAGAPIAAMTRNIAYAASDGDIVPNPEELKVIRRYLHNFYRIGVREKTMLERMDQAGIPAVLNIDPVILAGTEVLDQICAPVKEKDYVLTYEAIDDPKVASLAANIAAENGLKVLPVARTPYSKGRNKYGPAEFITLIKNASHVVTTSFHATALSILYGKSFDFIHTDTKADGRIDSLLNSLGDNPAESIEKLRRESMDFILEALKSDTSNEA